MDLTKILKNVPKGTRLYSPIFGTVELLNVANDGDYPIEVRSGNSIAERCFASDGRYFRGFDGECMLFPSKDQRDWTKFEAPVPKTEVTLHPFDKVLARDSDNDDWRIGFFSHFVGGDIFPYRCSCDRYTSCIPYNERTAHLLGTRDAAPEFSLTFSKEIKCGK